MDHSYLIRRPTAGLLLKVSLTLCICMFFMGMQCPQVCTTDADCPEGQVCNTTSGQCEAAPTGCTSDADCEEGEVCNTESGECEPAPTPCTSDADCEEGEVCNTESGECEPTPTAGCTLDADCEEDEWCVDGECEVAPVENPYETAEFDHDFHSGSFSCDTCHHDGAGLSTCDTCHDRDEVVGGIVVLKDAMHNPDGGCWQCHDEQNSDGTRNCSVCHTGLDSL